MSGNVLEGCNDWYSQDYYVFSAKNNPQGPTNGNINIFRGGGWKSHNGISRISSRGNYTIMYKNIIMSFRLVLSI